MSLIPQNWTAGGGRDYAFLEIEHDRMAEDEPFVVTLFGRDVENNKGSDYLFCATPEQAREMAAALLVYAHFAEQAEAARPSRETDQPKEDLMPVSAFTEHRTVTEWEPSMSSTDREIERRADESLADAKDEANGAFTLLAAAEAENERLLGRWSEVDALWIAAKTEVDRLRTVLKGIWDYAYGASGETDDPGGHLTELGMRAKEALESPRPSGEQEASA